jgi:hypothetical protein
MWLFLRVSPDHFRPFAWMQTGKEVFAPADSNANTNERDESSNNSFLIGVHACSDFSSVKTPLTLWFY